MRSEPPDSAIAPLTPTDPPRSGELDAIFPEVYEELRRVAHRQMRVEASGHTLTTTALVHEAYLRLSSERGSAFENRAHFFASAGKAMRRILVDHARRRQAAKRGANAHPVSLSALDDAAQAISLPSDTSVSEGATVLMALDEALNDLAAVDARLARLVELRFFVGLSERETAEVLGVSPRTVTRDWVRVRAWLKNHLDAKARRDAGG